VVLDALREQIKELGITKNVVKAVEETAASNIAMLKKNDKSIFSILDALLRGKNFLSEHSMLCSIIATQVAKSMNWNTESTLQKISMFCLLHDCTLEDPELASIIRLDSPEAKNLTKEQKAIISEHPFSASNLIKSAKDIYPDVDTVIAQHHEQPDSQGFPRKLGPLNITPMSCLLIMSEDFVHRIYKQKITKAFITNIMLEFRGKYSKGNFKKVLKGFQGAFE